MQRKPAALSVMLGAISIAVLFFLLRSSGSRLGAIEGEALAGPAPAESSVISCLGRIVPGERVIQVSAPNWSVVDELRVKRGDKVKKGQVVAVLRGYESLFARLRQNEMELDVDESLLDQTRAGAKASAVAAQSAVIAGKESVLRNALAEHRRIKELHDKNIVPAQQLENAELGVEQAREDAANAREILNGLRQAHPADVAVAESRVQASKARLRRAEQDVAQSMIKAPIDGEVLEINAYPSESVGPRGILDLGDTDNMVAEAEVYVTDIGRVRIGAPATVRVEGLEGELSGKVAEVLKVVGANNVHDPDPLTYSDRRVVKARIRLDDSRRAASLCNSRAFIGIVP